MNSAMYIFKSVLIFIGPTKLKSKLPYFKQYFRSLGYKSKNYILVTFRKSIDGLCM